MSLTDSLNAEVSPERCKPGVKTLGGNTGDGRRGMGVKGEKREIERDGWMDGWMDGWIDR